MEFTSYAKSSFDLSQIKDAGLSEVLLAPTALNRLSQINMSDHIELCKKAKDLGLRVILEWDILINECDFDNVVSSFEEIPTDAYQSIRVQDPGVLEYVLEHTDKPIQFITESGNHNLVGLKKWESYIGERLERLILSNELSKELLTGYARELSSPLEILVLGRILLFYSPRKLLSPTLSGDKKIEKEYLEAMGESEESPHKGFPIIENSHGSFMFHIKDLFLLDRLSDIESIGIDFLRVDLRFSDTRLLKDVTENNIDELKINYGREVIRGYFQINKSDVLFKKLKNSRLQRRDEGYLGEILEARKSDFMAIHLKGASGIKLGDELKFITPEGKEHFCKVHTLKDLAYQDQELIQTGKLALINYVSGVWTKSQVYLKEK